MSEHAPIPRVILVEDNDPLREEMMFQLQHSGLDARGVRDAPALDKLLAERPCDILVLDLNLPGENGFSIARRLCDRRQRGIIMLTARDEIDDKLRGLEEGADIYLVKPVDRRELLACIRTLFRRVAPEQRAHEQSGWFLRGSQRLLISPDGRELELTAQDMTVLNYLLDEAGSTRSRDGLVAALGIDFMHLPDGRVNTVMSRLRQKLAAFDAELRIVTWRNQGYSYVGPALERREAPRGPAAPQ
jgi:two-component system OmpR family response regulator